MGVDSAAFVVLLLGAPDSAKANLASALQAALASSPCPVAVLEGSEGSDAEQTRADLTLLCTSPSPKAETLEERLRQALDRGGLAWSVLAGPPAQRLLSAQAAVRHALLRAGHHAAVIETGMAERPVRWQWLCERCGDTDCERHQRRTSSRLPGQGAHTSLLLSTD